MNRIIKLATITGLILAAANSSAVAQAQVAVTGEVGTVADSTSGVAWPNPRFVAGSGVESDCITDKLTGLMWSKNGIIGFVATSGGAPLAQPNYTNTTANLNSTNWSNALIAITNMNSAPIKLCGFSDWRLPNKVELKSMVNYGVSNPATWLNKQGFSYVQPDYYWSSSTYASTVTAAWYVSFGTCYVFAAVKTYNSYVLPVRGGQ